MDQATIRAERENRILRKLLWLNHGHDPSALYGDDGEMQCSQCIRDFGFWDWKRTPAAEIAAGMQYWNLERLQMGEALDAPESPRH